MIRSGLFLLTLIVFSAGPAFADNCTEGEAPGSEHPSPNAAALEGDFTLTDSEGGSHTLSAYRGNYVVLEWVNFDCPFVKKHYGSGNMAGLQAEYTGKGVVWLAVCSSAPGKQGHLEGDALRTRLAEEGFAGTAYLLDPDGKVGKHYGAKTTPHLFVFTPELELIYTGAIDSIKSTNPDDISEATNYVVEVLEAHMAGEPVPSPKTNPYGCSVKY